MIYSAYVPFFNNKHSVLAALQSLQAQTIPPNEIFAIDDGSTDGGADLVEAHGYRCLRQVRNLGRGAARHRAMLEATGDLVVCCDATNVLPSNFVESLLHWFDDANLVAAYGRIQDSHPKGPVGRWRSRHLFKSGISISISHNSPLITYGSIIKRVPALQLGNFNSSLRHSEDAELGQRILAAAYDIVSDPTVPVFCNIQNTLAETLERYWRWYAGPKEDISLTAYCKNISYSIKSMAFADLIAGDLACFFISLICPHYQFFKSLLKP